jgi:argonaute-like protein implicated in RNA metabolism and viral defense
MSTKSRQNPLILKNHSNTNNNFERIHRRIRKIISQNVLDRTGEQPYSTTAKPPDKTDGEKGSP